MRILRMLIVIGAAVFLLEGCHTINGVKQDVTETVDGFSGKNPDSWVQKTDRWMKENMW